MATTNIATTDSEIEAAVKDELAWDISVDASRISVSVQNGVVTLTGTVPTYGALVSAERDAFGVLGVTGVINDLVIEFPSRPPVPSDADILSTAQNTLDWNPDIDSENIRVSVDAGEVTLTGTTPTHWDKIEAEQLVESLRGVISVRNVLGVVPTEKVSDEVVAERVIGAMERNVLVDAEDIDVTVTDGEVKLKGTVPTAAARNAAYRAASRTAGTVAIDDELAIAA